MLILLGEEVGEGAPAEKGATFSAATHSAWHANTASLHVETGAADQHRVFLHLVGNAVAS